MTTSQARPIAVRNVFTFRVTIAAAILFVSTGIAAEGGRKNFNVPAGEAERTLLLFSEQAEIHVLLPTDLVAGVRTHRVVGRYLPTQALEQMLAGTNLIAVHDDMAGALTVRRAPPAPVRRKRQVSKRERDGSFLHDETIELSPFVVTSDKDLGYLAGNALSGSRMDIRLKDSAASISVFTEEVLDDFGASSLSEAMVFGNNTMLDFGEAGDFGSGQEGNSRIEFEQRYRIRGLPATVSRNYFKWTVPVDLFNVGRVEESRGPNSILFGVGSAGGIINVVTKQATLDNRIGEVLFAVGSHGSRRSAIDFNELLTGKSAVRLNAVWDKAYGFRHWQYSENRRVHLAFKYRPTQKTQIRAEVETGEVAANVPRSWVLTDFSLPWIQAGRPTFSPAAADAEFAGLGSRLGSNNLRYVSNVDQLINMRGQILTAPGPQGEIMVLDPTLADRSINVGGPGQVRNNRFRTASFHFERQLASKTFLEVAFNHQYYDFESYDPINANRYYGDPNQVRPGALGENPFAGAALLETNWRLFEREEWANTVRASLSQELDAGKWGLYRAAVLADYRWSRYKNRNSFETWEGAPFNPTPESGANRVTRRTYITLNDWSSYYVDGPGLSGLLTNVPDPTNPGRMLSSTWIPAASVNDDLTVNKSVLVGLQAAYFDGRLVAGLGYRYDQLTQRDRQTNRHPVTRIFEVDYGNVDYLRASGNTITLGLVGHVSKNVSLIYNQSSNIDVPDPNIRVLPDVVVPDPPEGRGRDYGIGLDLFDGKLYARAVRYTTDSKGEVGFGGLPIAQQNNRMLDGLLAAGEITQAEYDARNLSTVLNGRTRDKATEGYEFTLTANPTPNWRIQAGYSITDGVEDEIVPEVVAWWTEARLYFESFPQDIPTGVGVNTIGSTIDIFQEILDGWKAAEGLGLVGNRKHKANFFTRYTFSSGWREGLYVGGGYRYLGGMLAGKSDDGVLQYTPPVGEASFLAGRDVELKRGHRLRLQLNITNFFDEKDPIVVRYFSSGDTTRPRQIINREPRTWRITADFSF